MDRSLDAIISERPEPRRGGGGRGRGGRDRGGGGGGGGDRRPPPARAPRREEYPRDGVRKFRRDEPANIDSYGYGRYSAAPSKLTDGRDWVHDRFEDDRYDRRHRAPPIEDDRYGPRGGAAPSGSKLRVDNVHYELTEEDLRELFERIGPTTSVKLLYDRNDRSQGTAFVIYEDERDARDAVYKFDGQNANGQAIRVAYVPSGPSGGGAPPPKSLIDRIGGPPPRSLFDRIEGGRDDSREGGARRRRNRSDSPRKTGAFAPAPDVDRYVPGRGSRSPIRRRWTPRGGGRRPGERREGRGGGGPRKPREDGEGRQLVGGRPRKTAEELDAEMADYWGGKNEDTGADNGAAEANDANGGGDIEMDI